MEALSETLQAALDQVDPDEVIQLEKDLVSIPSYTTEEHELVEYIADFYNDLGIEVELQRVEFPGNKKSANAHSFNPIGRIRGTGDGPSLMFNEHMDHGPIEGRIAQDFSNWQREPYVPVVEDGYLYGKGCQDEKGGICAFLSAARAIKRAGIQPKGDLVFAPVCGHKTHSIGTKAMIDAGILTDMAINSENSGNGIVPMHVGVMTARVHVNAAPVHPSRRKRHPQFRNEPTTIERSMQFIQALGRDCVPHKPGESWITYQPHPYLTDFPIHRIDSIEAYGYQHQAIYMMFRTLPGMTEASLKQDLERVIARIQEDDPKFKGRAEVQLWGPPLDTPVDADIVQSLAKFHEHVTQGPADVGPDGRYGSYGDGAVLSAAGITTVIYGPGGGSSDMEHELKQLMGEAPPDERIPIADLVNCAKVMTLATVDLCC